RSDRPTTTPLYGPGGRRPRRCSQPCRHARPPRSPASAARFASGRTPFSPTGPPTAPTTAAPKRSTASSNSTDAWPAATATERTTVSGCCSSPAGYRHDPTLRYEEPPIALTEPLGEPLVVRPSAECQHPACHRDRHPDAGAGRGHLTDEREDHFPGG